METAELGEESRDTEYIPSGIQGLDELLDGKGLPKGSINFIVGGPGSGKTTLGLQFLCNGAASGDHGVYFSLDEPLDSVIRNSAKVGLNVGQLYRERKIGLLDASTIISVEGEIAAQKFLRSAESGLTSLINKVDGATRSPPAQRLVIDSLATLILQFPVDAERRLAIKGIIETIRPLNCTTLLVSELSNTALERSYAFEEYLSDGVMVMMSLNVAGRTLQTFTVEKMRGVDHDKLAHPYKIVKGGIQVFPKEAAEY